MTVCPSCSSPLPEGAKFCPACGYLLSGDPPPQLDESDRTADASDEIPSDSGRRRLVPGRVLGGRYRIVRRIGAGGMGEVYLAEDLTIGEEVALKFLPAGLEHDEEKLSRLKAEVRLARKVTHLNVAKVYDFAENFDGFNFISMEYVDGENLASLLHRIGGRLSADKAALSAREICLGLQAIHDCNVLHRDLKPANVMIDGRGHVRITDFGLAEQQGAVANEEFIVGTPAYMSPETLDGQPADTRSDLYSLGLVLFEMFTGRRAFEAKSIDELRRLRRQKTPPSPSGALRDIDPGVDRVIVRCLQRDPKQRPSSARAVADMLPRKDPLDVAMAEGQTPSPHMIIDSRDEFEGLPPGRAWMCLAGFVIGTALLVGLAPQSRIVPAAPLTKPPSEMSVRARDLIDRFGSGVKAHDSAQGFRYRDRYVDWISKNDHSASRWQKIGRPRPPVVNYWYRQSPTALTSESREPNVDYDHPPRLLPGMAGVELDPAGRLLRLDALPDTETAAADSSLDWAALFAAAGLDPAHFHAVPPVLPPATVADLHVAWVGSSLEDPSVPLRVEGAAFRGRPVYFAVREPWDLVRVGDPSRSITDIMISFARPLLFVIALVVGAWLARRNVRGRREDRRGAIRVASVLMAARILIWVLGAHHTAAGAAVQLVQTIALGLYDFVFGWIFYVAVEPYVRRLWPRVLKTWHVLLDGRYKDPLVGRDLLVGCLVGVAIGLAVVAHQGAPVLLRQPPGRPDNVGFVEHELVALTGILPHLADMLIVQRSALILAMEFVVILVMVRLILRRPVLSLIATFALFIPFALPKGQILPLNIAFAAASLGLVLFVMMRFGLLAAVVALLVNSTLQAAPLKWQPDWWGQSATTVVLLLIVGLAVYGFVRSLGGKSGIPDPEHT